MPNILVLKAASARNEERLRAFCDAAGWESYETDWRKLVARDDIDVIDIAAPNNMHLEMAVAAAEAGKMIWCEKPLARNSAEGAHGGAVKSRVRNMVWYNYRRVRP
jgi:predicted dehydrogenase